MVRAKAWRWYVAAVGDSGRPIGEDSARARYLNSDVELVLELAKEGYGAAAIARMMDMPRRTVRDYLAGARRNQSVATWKRIRYKPRKKKGPAHE